MTFGHVHIADLTAEGPISVRDSIELTKFKHQSPDEGDRAKNSRRKVLFNVDEESESLSKSSTSPGRQTAPSAGIQRSSSGSQIIRVEMGSRSPPRSNPSSQRHDLHSNQIYSNSMQRSTMASVGTRQQQQHQMYERFDSNSQVENKPTDAEINWLWEKVKKKKKQIFNFNLKLITKLQKKTNQLTQLTDQFLFFIIVATSTNQSEPSTLAS